MIGDMIINSLKVIGIVSLHVLLYTILLEWAPFKQYPAFIASLLVVSCIIMIKKS